MRIRFAGSGRKYIITDHDPDCILTRANSLGEYGTRKSGAYVSPLPAHAPSSCSPFPQFTGPTSKATARALNLAPGTWLSARVQLLVGFAVSGIAHAPADYMVGPTWLGRSVPFFLWQALGITIEDLVTKMAAARGVKPAWWTYALGYVWTWPVWFVFTVPIFTGWMMQSGMGHTNIFTWSVVRPLLEWSELDIARYIVPEMRYTH